MASNASEAAFVIIEDDHLNDNDDVSCRTIQTANKGRNFTCSEAAMNQIQETNPIQETNEAAANMAFCTLKCWLQLGAWCWIDFLIALVKFLMLNPSEDTCKTHSIYQLYDNALGVGIRVPESALPAIGILADLDDHLVSSCALRMVNSQWSEAILRAFPVETVANAQPANLAEKINDALGTLRTLLDVRKWCWLDFLIALLKYYLRRPINSPPLSVVLQLYKDSLGPNIAAPESKAVLTLCKLSSPETHADRQVASNCVRRMLKKYWNEVMWFRFSEEYQSSIDSLDK